MLQFENGESRSNSNLSLKHMQMSQRQNSDVHAHVTNASPSHAVSKVQRSVSASNQKAAARRYSAGTENAAGTPAHTAVAGGRASEGVAVLRSP